MFCFRKPLCLTGDLNTMGDPKVETPTSKAVVNHRDMDTVIEVRRPVYHTKEFRDKFRKPAPPERSCKELLRGHLSNLCTCSKDRCKKILVDTFPFLGIMRKYKVKTDLPNDLIAGLTVGIMQLPQSKAKADVFFTLNIFEKYLIYLLSLFELYGFNNFSKCKLFNNCRWTR